MIMLLCQHEWQFEWIVLSNLVHFAVISMSGVYRAHSTAAIGGRCLRLSRQFCLPIGFVDYICPTEAFKLFGYHE